MSVRLKLIITYFILILLSLVLLISGMIRTTRQMAEDFAESVLAEKSIEDVATAALNTLVDIEYILRHEPALFNDENHMMSVEENVDGMNMALFVESDDVFVYNSHVRSDIKLSTFVDGLDFQNGHGGDTSDSFQSADYSNEDHYYMVLRRDVSTEDQEGFLYFVYEAESKNAMHWSVYGGMYRLIVVILILIVVSMTVMITRLVIKPLNKLEEATDEIRQGNLDFSVKTSRKDEFGRVMNAFDTMRGELKHSIDQQMLYEENRKELIASISHDLKTPITSIKGYVEGIRDGVASDEEKMDKYLEVIYHKSNDLDKLIDDLFLFSKLDLNRLPFDFKTVSAKRFFEDSGDEIRMDATKQGFEVNFSNALSEEMTLCVDQQQFKRVITNIVSNAVKYSLDKKKIDIAVTASESMITMAIRDYGKGIEAEALERIFEKFYRVDQARNMDIGGSGLGLAIAKQIINRHEGSIRAESVLGKGTTIYIEIGRADINHE